MELMKDEVMVDIVGYIGRYAITNMGRVYTHAKQSGSVMRTAKFLKPKIHPSTGYYTIRLFDTNKKAKDIDIHILVARHFVPNPEGLKIVMHIDDNKLNPVYTNLKWSTTKHNNKAAYDTGIKIPNDSRPKPVIGYTSSGSYEQSFSSIREAEQQTNADANRISTMCRGVANYKGNLPLSSGTHNGEPLKWKFANI